MGIVKDLRKEKERLEKKVKAAEHLRNVWKRECEKEKAQKELLELVLSAAVLKQGGELDLTMEDIGNVNGKYIEGQILDESDGRVYKYRVKEVRTEIREEEVS